MGGWAVLRGRGARRALRGRLLPPLTESYCAGWARGETPLAEAHKSCIALPCGLSSVKKQMKRFHQALVKWLAQGLTCVNTYGRSLLFLC